MIRRKARHRDRRTSWAWPVAALLTFAGTSSVPLGMAARYGWEDDWSRAWAFLAIFCALATAGCVLSVLVLLLYRQNRKADAR